jgi:hypothetical protein
MTDKHTDSERGYQQTFYPAWQDSAIEQDARKSLAHQRCNLMESALRRVGFAENTQAWVIAVLIAKISADWKPLYRSVKSLANENKFRDVCKSAREGVRQDSVVRVLRQLQKFKLLTWERDQGQRRTRTASIVINCDPHTLAAIADHNIGEQAMRRDSKPAISQQAFAQQSSSHDPAFAQQSSSHDPAFAQQSSSHDPAFAQQSPAHSICINPTTESLSPSSSQNTSSPSPHGACGLTELAETAPTQTELAERGSQEEKESVLILANSEEEELSRLVAAYQCVGVWSADEIVPSKARTVGIAYLWQLLAYFKEHVGLGEGALFVRLQRSQPGLPVNKGWSPPDSNRKRLPEHFPIQNPFHAGPEGPPADPLLAAWDANSLRAALDESLRAAGFAKWYRQAAIAEEIKRRRYGLGAEEERNALHVRQLWDRMQKNAAHNEALAAELEHLAKDLGDQDCWEVERQLNALRQKMSRSELQRKPSQTVERGSDEQ